MFGLRKTSVAVPVEYAGDVVGVLVANKLGDRVSVKCLSIGSQTFYGYEFYATKKEFDDVVRKLDDKQVRVPYWDNFDRMSYRRP